MSKVEVDHIDRNNLSLTEGNHSFPSFAAWQLAHGVASMIPTVVVSDTVPASTQDCSTSYQLQSSKTSSCV